MKKLILIFCFLPACQAVRDARMAKAINDNIALTEKFFRDAAAATK